MSRIKWRNGLIISVVLAVFALVVGLLASDDDVSGNGGDGDNTESSVPDSDDLSEGRLSELAEMLTVSTISDDAACSVEGESKLVDYDIGALKGVPPRLWSDALSTPVEATEPEPARDEIQDAICKDVLLGVTYLVFLATDVRDELFEKTGLDLVELNKDWLKPFAVEPDQISTLAAEFIPLLGVEPQFQADCEVPEGEDPSVCWTAEYRHEVVQAAIENREWQNVAAHANTLLDRFEVMGIEARMSVVNYHLAIGGLVVGNLPAVERNPNQEDLPALILTLTDKDQCVPLLVIGFNMGDKRPELFEPPVCEEPTPTTQPPPPPGTNPPTTQPPTTEPPTTEPPTTEPCPDGLIPENGDCVHPTLPEECQQNGVNCPDGVENDVIQDPQDNTTAEDNGVNTGPTPGAPDEPTTPPPGPTPQPNTPAPEPNDTGYDSGSPDGSGTPGGSTCDNNGCTGGGPTPPASGTAPVVEEEEAPTNTTPITEPDW